MVFLCENPVTFGREIVIVFFGNDFFHDVKIGNWEIRGLVDWLIKLLSYWLS